MEGEIDWLHNSLRPPVCVCVCVSIHVAVSVGKIMTWGLVPPAVTGGVITEATEVTIGPMQPEVVMEL